MYVCVYKIQSVKERQQGKLKQTECPLIWKCCVKRVHSVYKKKNWLRLGSNRVKGTGLAHCQDCGRSQLY